MTIVLHAQGRAPPPPLASPGGGDMGERKRQQRRKSSIVRLQAAFSRIGGLFTPPASPIGMSASILTSTFAKSFTSCVCSSAQWRWLSYAAVLYTRVL
jgi:hypothetical protein